MVFCYNFKFENLYDIQRPAYMKQQKPTSIEGHSLFECILRIQKKKKKKKKMPNALQPHDNIWNTMASFRFFIKSEMTLNSNANKKTITVTALKL